MNARTAVGIGAAATIVGGVVLVVILAVIPLPDFGNPLEGRFEGALAYIDTDNCVNVARLNEATTRELRCEPDRVWVDDLQWTSEGLEVTTYLNQPTTKILDPKDGSVIDTMPGVVVAPRTQLDGFVIDRPAPGELVVTDMAGNELIALEGPESYWIEAVTGDGSGLFALVDSHGRLAVFDTGRDHPSLVGEDVRAWPPPAWQPAG